MAAPQNKPGWSSNCIFCQDHQLDLIAQDLGIVLAIIATISLICGFVLEKRTIIASILTLTSLAIAFLIYYQTTWINRATIINHMQTIHRNTGEIPSRGYQENLINDHQRFQRKVALKGWTYFVLVPFTIGFGAGAIRRRLRATHKV